MGRSVLEALGAERELSEQIISIFNNVDREAMITIADVHKPGIKAYENEEYVAKVLKLLPEWEATMKESIKGLRDEYKAK